MPLTELTKITGPGIKTDTNWVGNHANYTGIVTATKFVGDGSDLTSLPAGLGTALSADQTSPLNSIYYVNDVDVVTPDITNPLETVGAPFAILFVIRLVRILDIYFFDYLS